MKLVSQKQVKHDVQRIEHYIKNNHWPQAQQVWSKYQHTDVYQYIEIDLIHHKLDPALRELPLVIPIRDHVNAKTFLPVNHRKKRHHHHEKENT